MKKLMSIAAIALFMAGSSAFACDGCGCSAKKAETKKETKTECASCSTDKKAEKTCPADSKKASCTKATEEKKADTK
ncbi:hypothetical protein P4C99_10730 [Pontiellaceae bacterium B1224]|nr:hypothetical protein [Pontiellaceae bacterium B1224]